MKKIFAFVALMAMAMAMAMFGIAQAQDCSAPKQPGCWELVAVNIAWDEANPLLRGLDKPSANDDQRLNRAETLGKSLWQAQHQKQVQTAGPASFLVFIWNASAGAPQQPTGYRVTGSRSVEKYSAEEVKDKVVAATLEGYGKPSVVYRVKTDGVSASVILPHSMMNDKTFIVVCREGKNGVYPNTTTLKQGHAITAVTLKWYQSQPEGGRTLIPFVSKS